MKLKDVLIDSIRFAIANTFHKPLVWIGISLLTLISIISINAGALSEISENIILLIATIAIFLFSEMFLSGMKLKIYRGEYADFSHPKKSLFQGFQDYVIYLIYLIIPFALLAVAIILAILDFTVFAETGEFSDLLNSPLMIADRIISIINIVLSLIITAFFVLIYIPARINFARREKFSAAFNFRVIIKMIKKLGTGKYMLGVLYLILPSLLLGVVICILGLALIPCFTVIFASMGQYWGPELLKEIIIAALIIFLVPFEVIYRITLMKYMSELFASNDDENSVISVSEENTSINQEEASAETPDGYNNTNNEMKPPV